MNALSQPTLAKGRSLILVASIVIGLLAFQIGNAQSVATGSLTSGGLNSITIDRNGVFTLTLGVTTNFPAGGYTVFLRSDNGSGLFQINGRASLDPIFPIPPLDPTPFPLVLNPATPFDLGLSASPPNATHPPGTFALQEFYFSARNAPVGTYTIFLDPRSVMTDRTGGGFADVNMTAPAFTVNVVPEPTTVGLLAMGGVVASVLAWRKRRAAA